MCFGLTKKRLEGKNKPPPSFEKEKDLVAPWLLWKYYRCTWWLIYQHSPQAWHEYDLGHTHCACWFISVKHVTMFSCCWRNVWPHKTHLYWTNSSLFPCDNANSCELTNVCLSTNVCHVNKPPLLLKVCFIHES